MQESRRIHPLSLKRRAAHHSRVTAKHDLVSALERLHRQDGVDDAYRQELERWAALLGYRLDVLEEE